MIVSFFFFREFGKIAEVHMNSRRWINLKKLIIAEKPNYAKTCVKAIEKMESMNRKDGYYESRNYIVSYAFGHLFSLYDIDKYMNREKTLWSMDELPFIPEHFQFHLQDDEGIKNQYKILCGLMNRNDVEGIIHCGDADREGEIIVRLIIEHGLQTEKPIYRIWSGSQTEEEILENLKHLKNDKDYDLLAQEGYARTYMDWLIGINMTRFLTLLSGRMLNAGRVLVPIVKAIYDRDMEIYNFTPTIYYVAEGKTTEGVSLVLNQGHDLKLEEAKEIVENLNQEATVVTEIQKKRIKSNSPKLFSLSKLQSYMGAKHKFSPDKTLQIVQNLYENGYVSYPRTNTEYLSNDEKGKVEKIIEALSDYPLIMKDKKTIFDDSKIEGHSALVPMYKVPKNGLSKEEQLVYEIIRNRFVAVFCAEECILNKTIMKIKNGNYEFKLQGKSIQQMGWMKYEKSGTKDQILPNFMKGDKLNVKYKEVEKKTNPPKHYTIATLMSYLEKPFLQEKKDMDEAYRMMLAGVTIGTPATRAGIIKNAVEREYINLNDKGIYTITELGKKFIHLLDQLEINLYKDKTVEMNQWLIAVNQGEMTVDECVERCSSELRKIISKGKSMKVEGFREERKVVGTCPLCGKIVKETKTVYVCENHRMKKDESGNIVTSGCPFFLQKQTKFCGMKITPETAQKFLMNGFAKVNNLKKKDGGTFTATVKVDFSEFTEEKPFPKYELKFSGKKKRRS